MMFPVSIGPGIPAHMVASRLRAPGNRGCGSRSGAGVCAWPGAPSVRLQLAVRPHQPSTPPPLDPDVPIPDDPGPLLPDSPDLPPAPREPSPYTEPAPAEPEPEPAFLPPDDSFGVLLAHDRRAVVPSSDHFLSAVCCGDDLVCDLAGLVGGDGEADADVAGLGLLPARRGARPAVRRCDGRRDADQFAG